MKLCSFQPGCVTTRSYPPWISRREIALVIDRRAIARSALALVCFTVQRSPTLLVYSLQLLFATPLRGVEALITFLQRRCVVRRKKCFNARSLYPSGGWAIKKLAAATTSREKIAPDNFLFFFCFFSESPIIPRSFLRAARYHDRYHGPRSHIGRFWKIKFIAFAGPRCSNA